jgi:L-malate glycosyltransferase
VVTVKIGVAGPMTLDLLDYGSECPADLPGGYDFPLVSSLVNDLLSRGHRVVAFTTSEGLLQPYVRRAGALELCVAPRRARHAGRDLMRAERAHLVSLMSDHPVDIMNAQWSYEFAWAALDTGRPTLVTLQDHATTILLQARDAYRAARWVMNWRVLRRAPYLSTISPYLYDLLPAHQRARARVIPEFYSPDVAALQAGRREQGAYVVSVCNGFGRRKNVGAALQAFALLRRERPDLEYRLIGADMEAGGSCQRFAQRNGLADGVCFVGRRPHCEVLATVAGARALVHPSLEESFGLAVLEAMALGTPVIGGRTSGNIPRLLDHGRNGLLCDVRSPFDLAASVIACVAEPGLAAPMAERARRFAHERFRQETVVQQYVEYYEAILGVGSLGPGRAEGASQL